MINYGTKNMNSFFKLITGLLLPSIAFQVSTQADQQEAHQLGTFLGAENTTHPDWFKESFLDFDEDIREAASNGKRLIVYFMQDGCPYCNLLVTNNFAQENIVAAMRKHFDLVMLNMWGDRDVVHINGDTFTEKMLAEALRVSYTPTLLFFDENKKVVLRMNGYYPPDQFKSALEYVHTHQENKISFNDFLASRQPPATQGKLNHQDWLIPPPFQLDRMDNDKPILVIFEQKKCENCNQFHNKTMSHDKSRELVAGFNAVQLDRYADTKVITPSGEHTTARKWATSLGVNYSPSLFFFDNQGKQVMKAEAFFKTFHLQGVMDYVLEKAYENQPNFQRYLEDRAENIRKTGKDVDIWSY